ncbi:hypothetical protein D3C72_2360290 [compost metagenome]
MRVEVRLELLGAAVLEGVAAWDAREQAGTGEFGEDDGHGAHGGKTGAQGNRPGI